ncbi:hypothetical protein BKA63DRAFT_122966 [Paraphoma chrysanthemicola]|nr:hypothetical protein BKA63DRAFT_122966 [Paraphoma chrysanthemicola]
MFVNRRPVFPDPWPNLASMKEAISKYEKLLKKHGAEPAAPSRPWSQTKVWDLRCKVAYTQLKLKPRCSADDEANAFETLTDALEFYEESHGKHDGKHDEHTRVCAHLLLKMYEDRDMNSKAKELMMLYALEQNEWANARDLIVAHSNVGAGLISVFLLLLVVTAILLYHAVGWWDRRDGEIVHGVDMCNRD